MQCQDTCKYAMSKAMSEENAHAKCYNATIKCNRVNMQPSNKFKSGPLRSRKYAKNMSKYASQYAYQNVSNVHCIKGSYSIKWFIRIGKNNGMKMIIRNTRKMTNKLLGLQNYRK